ncbi:D-2-hydroxyacid dehydrogenase (plasmid) [Haloferacaceae archaeon DSL9]
MPSVVIRHDMPIAEALDGTRSDLTVKKAATNEEARKLLSDADIFVINPASWDDSLLDELDEGNWVQATSTGYSAFPIEAFDTRGVRFTNATGNYGAPVADHAFALALGLARGLPTFVGSQRGRQWNRSHGSELIDLDTRTMMVVGMGDIGEAVARRGLAFGMDVYGTKRSLKSYDGVLPNDRILPPADFDSVLEEIELLVLTVPLTEETHHLIDQSTFELLPNSAILINVARGPVVDQEALIEALDNESIAGAGLDVFDEEPLPASSPLWEFENAILTPHVGGRSQDFVRRFVDLFLQNYDRHQSNKQLINKVV